MISFITNCCSALPIYNIVLPLSENSLVRMHITDQFEGYSDVTSSSCHCTFNQSEKTCYISCSLCERLSRPLCSRTQSSANRSPWIRLPRHLDSVRGKCAIVSRSCPTSWFRSWPCPSLVPWWACTMPSSPWPPIACVPSWLQLMARGQATSSELPLETDGQTDRQHKSYIDSELQ